MPPGADPSVGGGSAQPPPPQPPAAAAAAAAAHPSGDRDEDAQVHRRATTAKSEEKWRAFRKQYGEEVSAARGAAAGMGVRKPRFKPNKALQHERHMRQLLQEGVEGQDPRQWRGRWGRLMQSIRGVQGDDALLYAMEECNIGIRDLLHACVAAEAPVPQIVGVLYEGLAGCPRLADHRVADEAADALCDVSTESLNACMLDTLREVLKWRSLTSDEGDAALGEEDDIPGGAMLAFSLVFTLLAVLLPLWVMYSAGIITLDLDVIKASAFREWDAWEAWARPLTAMLFSVDVS